MRYVILFLFFCSSLYAQDSLQTVSLGPYEMEVAVEDYGYGVSTKNWINLGATLYQLKDRARQTTIQWEVCQVTKEQGDSIITELEYQKNMYKNRSIIYRDAYNETLESIYELNDLLNKQNKLIVSSSNKSTWNGVFIGAGVGILIGVVTTSILLSQ